MAAALIFDLDGTLADSAAPITEALNRQRALRGGGPLEKAEVRTWISQGAPRLIAHALGEFGRDPQADLAEFRAIYGALPPDPADLFAHVAETLAGLHAAGHKMAVCTNKPEHLARPVVAGMGIAPYFLAVVGARPGLPIKPDPAPVYEALRGIGAADAIYIGDSEVDAEAALAAGLPFLLATFGYAIGDIDAIDCAARFADFRELPAILRNLHR